MNPPSAGLSLLGRRALPLSLAFAMISVLCGCATKSGGGADQDAPLVFLLMGQSNMSGRGDLDDPAARALMPDPRIMLFSNDDVLRVAVPPIDGSANQIDSASLDKTPGLDPGFPFAKALIAADASLRIVLVPCAKGGSAMAEWRRDLSRDTLYGSCLARAKKAAGGGRIAAALWYQGESDAHSIELAERWLQEFETFVSDLRADLGDADLPVLMASIGDPPVEGRFAGRFPAWEIVQSAQARVALPGVIVVPAAGLPRNEDQLHLSTAGQIMLGLRLADSWLERKSRHADRK